MQQTDSFVLALQKWIEVSMQGSFRYFIRYARENGLSMQQLGALFHIHRRGSSGVTDVGGDLGVTSSAASQMLERLVQQELVLRSEDPNDRRVKRVALTEKGLRTLREGDRTRQDWLIDLAATLSDVEKESIIAALNILIEKANQLGQPIEPDEPDEPPIPGGVFPTCCD